MKKRIFCIILVFMMVLLSGCSDNYFSPVRFFFDKDYARKQVTDIIEGLAEDYEYMSIPTIDLNVGDRQSVWDGFSEKISENYIIDVDRNGGVCLYKYPKDRKDSDIWGEPVLTGHYVYANYNNRAIVFCEEKEDGGHYLLSYEFETGDTRYHATLEELYSFFDMDKSKWFVCCKMYKDML